MSDELLADIARLISSGTINEKAYYIESVKEIIADYVNEGEEIDSDTEEYLKRVYYIHMYDWEVDKFNMRNIDK